MLDGTGCLPARLLARERKAPDAEPDADERNGYGDPAPRWPLRAGYDEGEAVEGEASAN